MDYRHEIVHFSSQIPVKIFLHRVGSVTKHWHRSIEVLFVLSGKVNIIVNNRSYELQATDVIVINSLAIHEIDSASAELVALQTNPDDPLSQMLQDSYYQCCSAGDTENPGYNVLRNLLARLIKENAQTENVLLTHSLVAQLFSELETSFSVPRPEGIQTKHAALNQMKQVTDYIMHHFRDSISLQDVADHFHYSAPYLSRLFKQNLNVTFLEFYTDIRMESAVAQLLSGTESINSIAADNGFSSARSFVSAFQKQYNMLPSEYRLSHPSLGSREKLKTEVNYLEVSSSDSLSVLAAFLDPPQTQIPSPSIAEELDLGSVSCAGRGKMLRHTWRNVCCVGSSRDLLYGDVQQMLRKMQRDMPFRYVKFHGLLSDDLMLYNELPDGSISLSFTMLDKLLDFLQSVGLKPWMQLAFMPNALASDPGRTTFYLSQNCSLPKQMDRWLFLIRELVKHCIRRYGRDEVLSWPFCIWNEPDTTPSMFGFADSREFFSFYEQTYKAVKEIDHKLQVGSPSLLFLLDDPLNWYHPFFQYCRDHRCEPDFLNLHFYNDDITLDSVPDEEQVRQRLTNRLSPDPDAFRNYLDDMETKMADFGIGGMKIFLTEWNLTVSHRHLLNDTCFKSCYLTKNLLETYDRLESYGYWSMTDLIGESQLPSRQFHGGLGLFTFHGIPKAHYYSFCMLSKLGNTMLGSGSGWFLTRHDDTGTYSMILYHYYHYNQLISAGELFDMTDTDRYTAFPDSRPGQFTIRLNDVQGSRYAVRETFVNREHGSVYDTWVRMGGTELEQRKELEHLLHNSEPGFRLSELTSINGSIVYTAVLEPLEVRLVEFEPLE